MRVVGELAGLAIERGVAEIAFLLIACLLFVPLEHFVPARRRADKPRRIERFADAVHAVVNPTVAGVTAVVIVELLPRLFFFPPVSEAVALFRAWIASTPPAAQFFGALFVSAVCGYWIHRALHSSTILWRFHAVHHSSESVDWLSAHRQHPGEVALIVVATVGPPVLIGLRPDVIVGFLLFQKLHVFFSHSDFRFSFGPLRHLIVTPRHHHWHHEVNARCNYAGMFPFIDRLFGTYRYEPAFPLKTGAGNHVHRGLLQHWLHPLRASPARACTCREPPRLYVYGRQPEEMSGAAWRAVVAARPLTARAVGTRADDR